MRLFDLLLKSKRPLIHIGNGVRDAVQEFNALIKETGIPFITARNANDIVDWSDPLYVGRPGTFGQRGANFAVQTCDLYIAIGTRLTLTQTGYNTKDYARNAQIVQVDVDEAELGKGTLRDPLQIRLDAAWFMSKLKGELLNCRLPDWSQWRDRCRSWKERYPVCLPEYKRFTVGAVNSYCLIDTLSGIAAPDEIIVTDMGFAFQNTHQAWKTKSGQRLLSNCGLAPMGWGLPAAIGAAIGTGRPVILIAGDGGFMMNIQELATLAHHGLPIRIFLLNNGGYLTIKQTQQLGFDGRLMGVDSETGLTFPDFKLVADSYRIDFSRLETHANMEKKLRRQLASTVPLLVEVNMQRDQPQAPRSLNRRNPDGTMNPTKLEDSYPFLDPTIIEKEMSL